MRNVRQVFTIASLVLLISCNTTTWHLENYTYVGGPERYLYTRMEPRTERFYVGDTEIYVSLDTTTEDDIAYSMTETGPYQLRITASGNIRSHKSMTIEGIRARSSLGRDIDLGEEEIFPMTIAFRTPSQQIPSDYISAVYALEKVLNLDFNSDERLFLDLTVSVETNETTDKNSFSVEFYPFLDKGRKLLGPFSYN